MSPRIAAPLRQLHIPELERADRLERDVEQIFSLHGVEKTWLVGRGTEQQVFLERIRSSTLEKPHLLIAYTWIFYMALFSGGRYLRSRLQSAGSDFWGVTEEEELPLTFWKFSDGTNDGEDLKALYKSQVLDISDFFTEIERQEIVTEAVDIMRSMLRLVDEARAFSQAEDQAFPVPSPIANLLPTGLTKLIGDVAKAVAIGIHRAPNLIRGRID